MISIQWSNNVFIESSEAQTLTITVWNKFLLCRADLHLEVQVAAQTPQKYGGCGFLFFKINTIQVLCFSQI